MSERLLSTLFSTLFQISPISSSPILSSATETAHSSTQSLTFLTRWYYKSNLTPEEVILIKCFDSKLDGRARRVPHTAFHVPGTEETEGRESIEVRALVFHEGEGLE